MIGDQKMDFISRERLGFFLVVVSFWYLINLKVFNALHPVLAIPGSTIFITGLWLLLSLPIPTTKTSTYVPVETPMQATAQPVIEATPKPASKPIRKPTKKTRKVTRKTKSSKK